MAIQIKLFGFHALTNAVNLMKPVPSFIRDLLFKRRITHATTSVLVDLIIGGQKVAPLVKRGNPAKVMGLLGQKSNLIEPPQIRMKKFLTPSDLYYTRGADANIFVPGGKEGENQVQEARKQRMAREQKDMRDIGDRTMEMMCALALSGSYTIAQDEGVFVIDFGMPAANKPTLVNDERWSVLAKATPLKNMRAWKKTASLASGKIPTVAIMNSNTWEFFIACDEVLKYLDKLKINLGSINTDDAIIQGGAEKRAKIDQIEYFVYDGVYTDANGAQQYMVPDGKVSLVAPSADYRLHFGAIEDTKAGTVAAEYFSKDWVEEDPSGLWTLVESHPLPCVHEPAANIYATVL